MISRAAIVALAIDLAPFSGLAVDDVIDKLVAGLGGEVEQLRGLGVSFTAAEVATEAERLGLATLADELSQLAKVRARWSLILQQTKVARVRRRPPRAPRH